MRQVTHWLLFTLVVSLGLGQLLRYQLGPVTFYLHDLLVVALLILLTLQGLALKALRRPPLWAKLIGIGLLLGWLRALTLYPPQALFTPALYTLRLAAYLTLFLAVKVSKQRLHRLDFLISGGTALVIGLTQYLFLPDMRLFQYLGWDDHLDRLTLPHYDPSFTAVMLSLAFLMYFPLTYNLSSFFIPLYAFGILLTYARSVWLSFALTLPSLVGKKLLLPLLVILLAAPLFLPRGPGEGTNLFRTYSIDSRLQHDWELASGLGPNLITGVGYNTLISDKLSPKGYPQHAKGANNSYLMILATMGVTGLVGWLLLLQDLTRTPYRSTVIFLTIASFFNNLLLYPFALLWLLLLTSTLKSDL